MRDIRLFKSNKGKIEELEAKDIRYENEFSELLKEYLLHIFGIKILSTDYFTGSIDNGNIDIIGYDENNCPVIILYKNSEKENLILKGIYYMDWILDHRGDFDYQFNKLLDSKVTFTTNWSGFRLICISNAFSRYDIYASKNIKKNIELIKYREYNDLLYFEMANSKKERYIDKSENMLKNYSIVKSMNEKTLKIFLYLREQISLLGEDIEEIYKKDSISYKTFRNFVDVAYDEQRGKDIIFVNINLKNQTINYDGEFIRDVTKIDHFGNGNTEIKIKSHDDVDKAIKYINMSYNQN